MYFWSEVVFYGKIDCLFLHFQTQEREAKIKMKEKAKELHRARQEATKRGIKSPGFGGMGGGGGGGMSSFISDSTPTPEPMKSSYTAPSKPSGTSKAMKLGSKNKDVDLFVDQLKSEGENVTQSSVRTSTSKVPAAAIPTEAYVVHLCQHFLSQFCLCLSSAWSWLR